MEAILFSFFLQIQVLGLQGQKAENERVFSTTVLCSSPWMSVWICLYWTPSSSFKLRNTVVFPSRDLLIFEWHTKWGAGIYDQSVVIWHRLLWRYSMQACKSVWQSYAPTHAGECVTVCVCVYLINVVQQNWSTEPFVKCSAANDGQDLWEKKEGKCTTHISYQERDTTHTDLNISKVLFFPVNLVNSLGQVGK